MKKIFSILTAALTALLCTFNAFAYSDSSPSTGESMQTVYILVGVMAVALVAIIVLVIVRSLKKKDDE